MRVQTPQYFFSLALLPSITRACYGPSTHGTLQFSCNDYITRVTINNPPINLVNRPLIEDLHSFLVSITPDSNTTTLNPKIVIFDSANSDFFLDHFDLNILLAPLADIQDKYIAITRMLQNITTTAFIASINGRAFGAGQELLLQMDMRFAGPNALTGSIENSLSATAGIGGQLFLPLLINKGRALEYLLAAKAFDGPTGEKLGLFNHYYETKEELDKEVDALASRIALFSQQSLNGTKTILNALSNPSMELLRADAAAFGALAGLPGTQAIIAEAVRVSGNQSRGEFELGLPDSVVQDLYGVK